MPEGAPGVDVTYLRSLRAQLGAPVRRAHEIVTQSSRGAPTANGKAGGSRESKKPKDTSLRLQELEDASSRHSELLHSLTSTVDRLAQLANKYSSRQWKEERDMPPTTFGNSPNYDDFEVLLDVQQRLVGLEMRVAELNAQAAMLQIRQAEASEARGSETARVPEPSDSAQQSGQSLMHDKVALQGGGVDLDQLVMQAGYDKVAMQGSTEIARLEEEKRQAVQAEDYDLAQKLKLEIDALKTGAGFPGASALLGASALVPDTKSLALQLATVVERLEHLEQARLAQERLAQPMGNVAENGDNQPGSRSESSQLQKNELIADQYVFGESVYDAALFAGYVDFTGSVLIVLGWLINMAMQIGVIFIIGVSFTVASFDEKSPYRFKNWRAAEGHLYTFASTLSGASLVARVCNSDKALQIATNQLVIQENLADYFGRKGTKLFATQPGTLLCIISVVLWAFSCALEIRKTMNFVMALSRLPMAWHSSAFIISVDEEGSSEIKAMSFGHFAYSLFVALCRFTIAGLLLVFGSQWLANTTAITDLLLNASALGFVMDIDEAIFGVVASARISNLINSLKPLSSHARYSRGIPIILLLGVVASAIIVRTLFLDDLNTLMHSVREELCSEQTDVNFITGTNALGWMYYARSPPPGGKPPADMVARIEVTQLLLHGDPSANKFAEDISELDLSTNWYSMARQLEVPLADLADASACVDLPWSPGANSSEVLGARLWVATGEIRFKGVRTCDEVREYCSAERSKLSDNVRFMCPITCGCLDLASGLWDLSTSSAGCPWKDCAIKYYARVEMGSRLKEWTGTQRGYFECEEQEQETLSVNANWSLMLRRMYLRGVFNSTVNASFANMGCKALQYLSDEERDTICQSEEHTSVRTIDGLGIPHPPDDIHVRPLSGAAPFCPLSCNCIGWGIKHAATNLSGVVKRKGLCEADGGTCRDMHAERICIENGGDWQPPLLSRLARDGNCIPKAITTSSRRRPLLGG